MSKMDKETAAAVKGCVSVCGVVIGALALSIAVVIGLIKFGTWLWEIL